MIIKKYKIISSIQIILGISIIGTWILPHTTAIKNIGLYLGAPISIFLIINLLKLKIIKIKKYIFIIYLIFPWVILHFLIFSNDKSMQFNELLKIWLYIALISLFFIGFTISVCVVCDDTKQVWSILYLSMLTPLAIYFIKVFLTFSTTFGLYEIPSALIAHALPSLSHYIPKSDYVAMFLPILGISIGGIIHELDGKNIKIRKITLYLIVINLVFLSFYIQNTKNGILYATFLTVLPLIFYSKNIFKFLVSSELIVKVVYIILFIFLISIIVMEISTDEVWINLISDIKTAVQVERYEHWKYEAAKGLPLNSRGVVVAATTYDRVAWAVVGSNLLFGEVPLGYGLVEDSFALLAKYKWPEVLNLSHTHSGWLDFGLAFGLPGLLILLLGLGVVSNALLNTKSPISRPMLFGLLAIFLTWITTEVCTKIGLGILFLYTSVAIASCALQAVLASKMALHK